ncbi:hypothetical protein KJ762_11270 [bacterium]|nr:hypothetical protein [bacterium]MBU1065880.1 hypothetical protein [bacterium]MBU1635070.1 hypothetical protein [bacterium]MBU1874479.1 hypothetical protein [bacterium]
MQNKRTNDAQIKLILACIILTITSLYSQAQPVYHYTIDLNDVQHDRIEVTLNCQDFVSDQLVYHFPKVVPGTYEVSDFGRFIHKFGAFDKDGKKLHCNKDGKNSYIISDASRPHTIRYSVSDTWDMFMGLIRIYPMEGTNFDEGTNFVINPFAVFGYFENFVDCPANIRFTKPANLYGVSALPQTMISDEQVQFQAYSYHHLADCPIMFAPPDTVRFNVRNTEVLIGTYHDTKSISYAEIVHKSINPSMEAVGSFLDSLPADNYAFIYYFKDTEKLGEIIQSKHFKMLRIIGYLLKNGVPIGGALEHNNSTFGYSIDIGDAFLDQTMEMIAGMSVHEFFHIITPLNLHSQYIDNFNYIDPVMSKHLWLYEGVTEYFSRLVLVRSGLKSPKEFIVKTMQKKLVNGEKFPNEKMSFTEFSANVLEKGYKRQYMQVYQRGAVLAMLLDIEIIRLTDGEKTLLDVILELMVKYNKDHPFNEESFFDEFVTCVHPDLKSFFDNYIDGREEIPYQKIFDAVGVEYYPSIDENRPLYPIRENKVKYSRTGIVESLIIKKVKKGEFIGFQKGDVVNRNIFYDYFKDETGHYLPEDSLVEIPVLRDNNEITLPVNIKYVEKTTENKIQIKNDMPPSQERFYNIWLGIEN